MHCQVSFDVTVNLQDIENVSFAAQMMRVSEAVSLKKRY